MRIEHSTILQNHFSKKKIVYNILELLPIVYVLRFLSDGLATVILENPLSKYPEGHV